MTPISWQMRLVPATMRRAPSTETDGCSQQSEIRAFCVPAMSATMASST